MLSKQPHHITDINIADELKIIEASIKDPEKFGILYERYHEKIFRFIYKRVSDKEKAFDITSSVFLNALLNINKYSYKGVPFTSWLYRIAFNEIIKACKSNKALRVSYVNSENIAEVLEDINEDNREEYYSLMTMALEQLNNEELQLVEMRYFEKRGFKEISEIIGITENNAKVKHFRIIEKIKNILHLKK